MFWKGDLPGPLFLAIIERVLHHNPLKKCNLINCRRPKFVPLWRKPTVELDELKIFYTTCCNILKLNARYTPYNEVWGISELLSFWGLFLKPSLCSDWCILFCTGFMFKEMGFYPFWPSLQHRYSPHFPSNISNSVKTNWIQDCLRGQMVEKTVLVDQQARGIPLIAGV